MKRFALLILILSLSACQSAPDDVMRALLSYQADQYHHRVTLCLTIFDKDPSQQLLAVLQAAKANVLPASTCPRGKFGYMVNGEPALHISVSKVRRYVPWRATVEYTESTGAGLLDGSGWLVTLERVNGFWLVRNIQVLWIS